MTRPRVSWPWHLKALERETPIRGVDCARCRRNLAVPMSHKTAVICPYCAVDVGIVGEEEQFA